MYIIPDVLLSCSDPVVSRPELSALVCARSLSQDVPAVSVPCEMEGQRLRSRQQRRNAAETERVAVARSVTAAAERVNLGAERERMDELRRRETQRLGTWLDRMPESLRRQMTAARTSDAAAAAAADARAGLRSRVLLPGDSNGLLRMRNARRAHLS